MNSVVNEFRPSRTFSIRSQIAQHLRDAIRQGRFQAGSKLPPTQELATMWQTQPAIVHAAMTSLVKEGFIERMPRKGTFVRNRTQKLTHVGIYFQEGHGTGESGTYYHTLTELISSSLRKRNIHPELWADMRGEQSHHIPWEDLMHAAMRREIQGLIAIRAGCEQHKWLSKLPIPVAAPNASEGLPKLVRMEMGQAIDQALLSLQRRGCRSLGLISVLAPEQTQSYNQNERISSDLFLSAIGKSTLQTQASWIVSPEHWLPEHQTEQFGYDAFNAIWSQSQRPDGLLVFTDLAARGALMAMAQRQVRIPDELKLVLHRNVETGLFCPYPSAFLEVRLTDVAEALITQLQAVADGVTPSLITLQAKVAEAESISP